MIPALLGAAGLALLAFLAWAGMRMRRRNLHIWLPSYLRKDWAGAAEQNSLRPREPIDVMFCLADHFEPGLAGATDAEQRRRVEQWGREYPRLADAFHDSDGRPPRHTFFFPAEQYQPEHLVRLAELTRRGYGEVEVHLHHDGDTSAHLTETLLRFKDQLRSHGHLGSARAAGEVRFGFTHGNWALDNARPDGRWCGVNDELRVLRACGCYADFTLPSAPSITQTRRINSIYVAKDDPALPKSHDDGRQIRTGERTDGDLLLIQGPLAIQWLGGKWGLLPRIENGDLAAGLEMTPRRVRTWVRTRVCVMGRPNWLFVKVHTHGCNERNWPLLFGKGIRVLHETLVREYNDGARYRLHYVTAREMYNIARAAEAGAAGNPGEHRDFEVAPPPAVQSINASEGHG